ncbi:MAG: CPBP family intramembrane glutamic endopeptidase [Methanocella sp.]
MNYGRLLKVILFYLIIAFVVVFLSPLGPILRYVLIAAITLLFIVTSGIPLRFGNPIPGSVTGILAISSAFLIMLALGGVTIIGTNSGAIDVLAYGIILQAFVAFSEELSFRQYIFEDLDRATGRKAAIVLSAVGFALLHINSMLSFGVDIVSVLIGLATISLAGALLAVLYIYGGLLSAIGFHFFWNYLQYHVLGLGLRGEIPSLLDVAQTGNMLLTGGQFGPEVSLPGLAVVLITLGVVWEYYSKRQDRRQGGQEHKDAV